MTPPGPRAATLSDDRTFCGALPTIALATVAAIVLGVAVGATWLRPDRVLAALLGAGEPREMAVVWALRLPRVAMAALVGAALATSGVALQALSRNPLADPALLGVSSGAGLAAAGFLVFAAPLAGAAAGWGVPLAAFGGGLAVTAIVLRTTRQARDRSAAALILTGVALAAIAGAATGLVVFVADDAQLRAITFWSLGSVGGATWPAVAATAAPIAVAIAGLMRGADALDRLLLGELAARHLGIDTRRTTRAIAIGAALATGAAVAACGVIGFVGLVVPHVLRRWTGAGHRVLVPACALGGATLVVVADALARTIAAPAELPLGVVTALLGAPVLLGLARRGSEGWS